MKTKPQLDLFYLLLSQFGSQSGVILQIKVQLAKLRFDHFPTNQLSVIDLKYRIWNSQLTTNYTFHLETLQKEIHSQLHPFMLTNSNLPYVSDKFTILTQKRQEFLEIRFFRRS